MAERYSSLWWYGISARSFTAIRCRWSVEKLQRMALEGNETPVCGDTMKEQMS